MKILNFKFVIIFVIIAIPMLWIIFNNSPDDGKVSSPAADVDAPKEVVSDKVARRDIGVNFLEKPPSVISKKPETTVPLAVETSALIAMEKAVREQLTSLAGELNNNLDNPAKRQTIQEQYEKMTLEYNRVVIRLMKAKGLNNEVVTK